MFELTHAFADVAEEMLDPTWRKVNYRLDVLHATNGGHVEVY